MASVIPECHLWGETFSPARLQMKVPGIEMRLVTEPGEIQTRGKYRGQAAPFGACCITTPKKIEVSKRIECMADYIELHMQSFLEAGATEIIFWLYWTGIQGNMQFQPLEVKKIAALGVPLCIDYIQESEIENEKMA